MQRLSLTKCIVHICSLVSAQVATSRCAWHIRSVKTLPSRTEDLVNQCLSDKHKDTKRQRPTVMQGWSLLAPAVDQLVAEGRVESRHALFDLAVATFNSTQGDESCMVQTYEMDGIKLIDAQLPEFRTKLKKHYDAFPVELSAIPRKMLGLRCLRSPSEPPCTKAENETWYHIFTQNIPEKNYEWLCRIITAFQSRIRSKENLSGNPVKLGTQNVGTFRDMDPAYIHKLACTFYSVRPVMDAKYGNSSDKVHEIVGKFHRGVLDKPISEKVKLMDKNVDFKTLSLLLNETDTVEVLVQRSAQVDTIATASQAIVVAEYNYATAQLDTEGRTFDDYLRSNQTALKVNEDKRITHLEDREATFEGEADDLIKNSFQTRAHKDMVGAGTFVSTAIATYCERYGQVKEFMMKVQVYNLNYAGSRWGHLMDSVVASVATGMSESPERTAAIVICPLFAARNESDDMDTIAEQVREYFKDDQLELLTRMVNIDCDEASRLPSRPATYRAIMICSAQQESEVSQEGKTKRVPKSRFVQKSYLWSLRRCRNQFNMLSTIKHIDPVSDATKFRAVEAGERPELNEEKRTKQILTSESMWAGIFDTLFAGMQVEKSVHTAIVDYIPYDGTLQKYLVTSNFTVAAGMPTFMSVQPSWYSPSEQDRAGIAKYIGDELKHFLIEGFKDGRFSNTVVQAVPKDPPSLMHVPVLDETKFMHSKPDLESGVCRLKQDFVNKWSEVEVVKKQFEKVVKDWNEARNKDGDTWKANKRIASVAEQGSEESETNAPMHQPTASDPNTLAEAQAKNGAPIIIPDKSGTYDHVFFPDTGAYALNIKQDCQIKDSDYLVLIKGTFETGEPAKTIKEEKKLEFLPWDGISSMDDKSSFTHDIKGKAFPKGPVPLSQFVSFLETNGKVKVMVSQTASAVKNLVRVTGVTSSNPVFLSLSLA